MKRWDMTNMLDIGRKLFAKIHKQKKHANPNHDVHFMAREIDEWLPQGIQALIEGAEDEKPIFFIRADIKSFYRNIPHYKLISDIKQFYDDPKLIAILTNIITNPIDTPYVTRTRFMELHYVGLYPNFSAGFT